MTDNLQILHNLESYLMRDLSMADGDAVLDYLNDDPMETSPRYLAELFGFEPEQAESSYIEYQQQISELADKYLDAALANGEQFSEGLCNWAISKAQQEIEPPTKISR